MSDDYFQETKTRHLTYWITGHMLRGAGLAAGLLIGVSVTIWAIWAVGQFLPEESKQAPSPYGALEQVLPEDRATA